VEGLFDVVTVGHRLFCFALAQTFPLGIRKSEIGTFPDAAHFFALSMTHTCLVIMPSTLKRPFTPGTDLFNFAAIR
jgi:hypothetical protein